MQLVAEEEEEEEEQDGEDGVIGSVTLVLRRVEAVLPPPFPTTAPLRMYLCNMAVHTSHRRRGVAKALLQEAQRVGEYMFYRRAHTHTHTHTHTRARA
jgi:ribosomal protein S18 acetylase RimI-like enzyme